MTFLFPFPSHSHLIISIPTHSRSHFGQWLYIDYLKAEKYVSLYCVVNSKQNMKLQQKHCNQTHHSSVIIIIIITIIANHCSLFTVQRLWEFYFSPIKYAVPIPIRTIPIPIPISSPKLLPFPWESHGNGNSHSHAHLYSRPSIESQVQLPWPLDTSLVHYPEAAAAAAADGDGLFVKAVRRQTDSLRRWCDLSTVNNLLSRVSVISVSSRGQINNSPTHFHCTLDCIGLQERMEKSGHIHIPAMAYLEL